LSKLYCVKLFSANSTPTVMSVMGPRMERMRDGSLERNYPALARWVRRIESLPGYERTCPPHWRENPSRGGET
jgi:hypothetical protein